MKKTLFLITLLFTSLTYSQLDIIDKVAGTLLPAVVNGFKQIKEQPKKKKQEEVDKIEKNLKASINEILSTIDEGQGNVDAYNKLFGVTGSITDNLGAITALTNSEFLDAILQSKHHNALKEAALNFDNYFNEVDRNLDALQKLDITSSNADLQSEISAISERMKVRIGNLKNRIDREKNKPSTSMTYEKAETYIKNLNRSDNRGDISALLNDANDINVKIEDYIKSSSKHLVKIKESLQKIKD